jgi:hypothetical protein
MRLNLVLLFALIAFSPLVFAQSYILSGAVQSIPDGWEFRFTNTEHAPIVAFRARLGCPGNRRPYVIDKDSVYSFAAEEPLLPGETRGVRVAEEVSNCKGGVVALILENGQNIGEPDALAVMYWRRQGLYDGLVQSKNMIDALTKKNVSRSIIASMIDNLPPTITPTDPKERAEVWGGERFGTSSAAILFALDADPYIPDDKNPQRQPTTDDLMRTGMSKSLAHATAINYMLDLWIKGLQGHTTM